MKHFFPLFLLLSITCVFHKTHAIIPLEIQSTEIDLVSITQEASTQLQLTLFIHMHTDLQHNDLNDEHWPSSDEVLEDAADKFGNPYIALPLKELERLKVLEITPSSLTHTLFATHIALAALWPSINPSPEDDDYSEVAEQEFNTIEELERVYQDLNLFKKEHEKRLAIIEYQEDEIPKYIKALLSQNKQKIIKLLDLNIYQNAASNYSLPDVEYDEYFKKKIEKTQTSHPNIRYEYVREIARAEVNEKTKSKDISSKINRTIEKVLENTRLHFPSIDRDLLTSNLAWFRQEACNCSSLEIYDTVTQKNNVGR